MQADEQNAQLWLDLARDRSKITGYLGGTVNDNLWIGTMEVVKKKADRELAEKCFNDILKSHEQGTAPQWTVVESLYHLADSFSLRSKESVASDIVCRVQKTFTELHIIPTAVLRPDCVGQFCELYLNDKDLYISPRTPAQLWEVRPLALKVLNNITG